MGICLYLVIPCFNEEAVLPHSSKVLQAKLSNLIDSGKLSTFSRIVFVNDGSKDRTWDIIKELHKENEIFQGINLSCNRGHQNALLAGLMTVKDFADAVISMDADLQDDVNAIDEMIAKFEDGYEVVYGVRSKRMKDTWFKRNTAELFYKIMQFMGAKIVFNHADYRLLSKRALNSLSEFKEVNLFLRGIVPMVGYKSDVVYYEREERFAGESKYPLRKMLAFAFEGITSLTIEPVRMITRMGLAIMFISFCIMLWCLKSYFTGNTVSGWTSILLSVWGLGGLVLFAIGIIGEYIGKIYMETKARPRYIVSDYLNDEK